MPDSPTDQFLARRAEWITAGRPDDHPYINECRAELAKPRPTWVAPLVVVR